MLGGIDPGSYFNAFNESATRHAKDTKSDRSKSGRVRKATGKRNGESVPEADSELKSFASAEASADLAQAYALLDEIHASGERLRRDPNLSNMQSYRNLIQRLLNDIVSGAYRLEQNESGTNILKRKRFTVVTLINRKLDRLAAGLLQTQQEQIDLLSRVEEIQGLLVDLIQ